ncbi:unnamed protein product [Cuscuta europaea]|uniref:Uncharacterized protein n=1 Tax=Cuscuta europaea TaxID=41803 RepID=A0A9P0YWZ3_CUSEU|nr:unnamed protein product [Cuscuta europaea]
MVDKVFSLNFITGGTFLKTKYSGGYHRKVKDAIDMEIFSYGVLMEYVKEDCLFEEIGGVYVPNLNRFGWKPLTNDSDVLNYVLAREKDDVIHFWIDHVADEEIPPMDQNQPHVIVRPRKCILTGSNNPAKTNICILKSVQDDLPLGEDDMIPFKTKSYEQTRLENIEANNQRLTALGLRKLSVELDSRGLEKEKKRKQRSLKEGHQKTKLVELDGHQKEASHPKTRSRSNVLEMLDENECAVPTSTQLILQKAINEVVKKCTRKGPAKERNESGNGELGSMSAYIALKKKKKMIEVKDEGDSIDMQDTIAQQDNAEKGQETPQKSTAENQQAI